MLIIKNKQLEVLSEIMLRNFKHDAQKILIIKHPELRNSLTEDDLKILIDEGVKKALSYKIVERKDVLSFLNHIIFFGIDFDKKPPRPVVFRILRTENFTGSEKINRIEKLNLLS